MNSQEDPSQRLLTGLIARLEQVGRNEASIPDANNSPSVFQTFLARQSAVGPSSASSVDRRWFPIFAASRWQTISEQRRALESLAEPKDLDLTSAYTIGAVFGHGTVPLADSPHLSDEDYSIITETYLRSTNGSDQDKENINLCNEFIASIPDIKYDPQHSPFSRIASRFRALAPADNIDTFAAFRKHLVELKRSAVHIIGPDAITIFQALADPCVHFSPEQLISTMELARAWDLERPAIALLSARLCGDYPAERAYIEGTLPLHKDRLSDPAQSNLACLLNGTPGHRPALHEAATYEERMLRELAGLSLALNNRSPVDVCEAITRIYTVDPSIIDFLQWDKMIPIIQQIKMSTPAAAFTAMLTNDKSFRKSFPAAWLRMGNGAFIAALTSLLPPDGKADLATSLFSRIKDLPPQAASAMAHAVLEPEIFDRLIAASLTPRVLAEYLGQESSFTLLRIEALGIAESRGLVSKKYADEQIGYETDQARLQSLEIMMRSGRVRVPSSTINEASKWLAEAMPLDLMAIRQVEERDISSLKRIVVYFADNFVQRVLIESPSSINQALSNNLRHGFIIPRFLRAFDDALHVALGSSRRELPQWESAGLASRFHSEASELIKLREWMNDELKAFQDEWLSIAPESALYSDLRDAVALIIERRLQQLEGPLKDFCDLVSDATEKAVRSSLELASSHLSDEIKKRMLNQVRDTRRRARARENHAALSYLDTLETLLHDAVEEVAQWIGLAEESSEPGPFKLEELVKLELASTHSANWRRLKVNVFCEADHLSTESGSPQIKGRYFDVFQDVVHNLLSNAFTHSGQQWRTEVFLNLQTIGEKLILHCESSVTPERANSVARHQREMQQRARRRLDSRVGDDKLSGFLKMRLAYLGTFAREPGLTISVVRRRSGNHYFIVDLILEGAPEVWDA